jgi:hypothetical protein
MIPTKFRTEESEQNSVVLLPQTMDDGLTTLFFQSKLPPSTRPSLSIHRWTLTCELVEINFQSQKATKII